MGNTDTKRLGRARRKKSIRKRITGTSGRPRLSVFRSLRHIYAQVIDDEQGTTLATASSREETVAAQVAELNKTDAAKVVGKLVGERCLANKVEKVVFDRNGYIYHGRVRSLADGAREAGLDF